MATYTVSGLDALAAEYRRRADAAERAASSCAKLRDREERMTIARCLRDLAAELDNTAIAKAAGEGP